jgi:hypothetical protein
MLAKQAKRQGAFFVKFRVPERTKMSRLEHPIAQINRCHREDYSRINQMAPALLRSTISAMVVCCSVVACLPASAVTLSYEYSGTGSVSFQSDAILNIGGTCSSPCVFSTLLTISGTGPAASPTSGWATQAFATITDNLGDNLILGVNAGNVGTNHPINGGVFFPSILPSTLDVSTSSLASFLGGPGTIDYSISINLPDGAYVTPIPAALPLFATGLGALGLLGWRRKRKVLESQLLIAA